MSEKSGETIWSTVCREEYLEDSFLKGKKMLKVKKIISASLPEIIICLVTLWILRTQTVTGRTIIGSDTVFHFNRIYDAAMQLKHGNISWFMSLYGFNQTGRIVNAVYGPIFTYILGAILLLVKKWYRFQLVTSFLIYTLTGWGMYKVTRKTGSGRFVSTVIAIIYITIGWTVRWQTNMNFSALTGLLAPYGLMVAIDMIKESKINRKIAVELTILMTVAIECHIMSAVMLMLILVPAWIFNIIKNHAQIKESIKQTLLAVLSTIIFTLNTTFPLVWLSETNMLAMPRPMNMAQNALTITRKSTHYTGLMSWGNTRANLSSYMLLLLIIIIIFAIIWRKERPLAFAGAGYGSILLIISSNIVPWVKIQSAWPTLAQKFQFPARILSIAYVLLLWVAAEVLTVCFDKIKAHQRNKYFNAQLIIEASLILLAFFNVHLLKNDINANASVGITTSAVNNKSFKVGSGRSWKSFETVNNLTHSDNQEEFLKATFKPIPDYIASSSKLKSKAKKEAIKKYGKSNSVTLGKVENSLLTQSINKTLTKQKTVFHKSVKNNTLIVKWQGSQKVKVPVTTYAQSNIVLNGKILKNPKITLASSPIVKGREKNNVFTLKFNVPMWMTISIIFSLLSIVIGSALAVFYKMKN